MAFERVLFVNPFGIGDVIFTLHAVKEFAAAHPGCRIGFACNERTEPLLRMCGMVGETHVFNRDLLRRALKKSPLLYWKAMGRFLGPIRRARYDASFDYSLGREFPFWLACAGVRRRAGLHYRGRGLFLNRRLRVDGYESAGRHAADTQKELLISTDAIASAASSDGRLPLEPPNSAKEAADRLLRRAARPDESWLGIAPGGGRSWGADAVYKQWDPDRFARVADGAAAGRPLRVVLIGDSLEKGLLLRVAARMARVQPLIVAGERLEVTAAILRRLRVLVCNDGGLLHLASALGVPTVSVYGPVDERTYGPYRPVPGSETLAHPVECRPCYRSFRFPPCPHRRRCLDDLPEERVAAAVEKSLTL